MTSTAHRRPGGRYLKGLFAVIVCMTMLQEFPYLAKFTDPIIMATTKSSLWEAPLSATTSSTWWVPNVPQGLLSNQTTTNGMDISTSVTPLPKPSGNPTNPSVANDSSPIFKNTTATTNTTVVQGFGACLFVMDDNHFLIEWLAYHSYMLPLKHLIVAVDDKSKTSPRDILNRYQDVLDSIVLWQDDDYMQAMKNVVTTTDNNNHKKNVSDHVLNVNSFILRQRVFYWQCMRRLKADHVGWVAMIDTDEFVVINPNASWPYQLRDRVQQYAREEQQQQQQQRNETNPPPKGTTTNNATNDDHHTTVPFSNHNTTLWDLLQVARQVLPSRHVLRTRVAGACIPMARLLLSTRSSPNVSTLLTTSPSNNTTNDTANPHTANNVSFSTHDFLTLRYQHHFGLDNRQKNRKVKSLIDLSQISWKELEHVDNVHAHRPIESKCSKFNDWITNGQSPIIAHHYVGTWDQWTFRDDPRSWTRKKQNKWLGMGDDNSAKNNNKASMESTMAATTWLEGFVQQVKSVDRARSLLANVGYVPPKQDLDDKDDLDVDKRRMTNGTIGKKTNATTTKDGSPHPP